jgi:hypothetical protein
VSAGFAVDPLVEDGATESVWDFGTGYPMRASLEHSLGSGLSAGVAASYMRVPLVYSSAISSACSACNAHATLSTYGAVLHGGGGRPGLGQAFELFLGAMQYANFERDSPRTSLPPSSANIDFMFSVGYGFGYSFSNAFRLELMQEYANTFHERTNLPGNAQTRGRYYFTRLGVRVGF